MAIWALGEQMYMAIASDILYMNSGYFKFDRVGI
jgi:hypothetical protein